MQKQTKKWIANGGDRYIPQSETLLWRETYIAGILEMGEIKIDTLLDEVDEVLEKVTGKTVQDFVDEKKKEN